jgi:DNA polymerase-3 subunit alpha
MNQLEPAIAGAIDRQRAAAKGQLGFDMMGTLAAKAPEPAQMVAKQVELPVKQRLAWERELLGIYLSDHPVNDVLRRVGHEGRQQINDVESSFPGDRVRIVGRINTARRILTKNNKTMAVLDFEDMTGSIELVAFPETYATFQDAWEVDNVIDIEAKIDRRGDQLQLICERVFDSIDVLGPTPSTHEVHIELTDNGGDSNARIDEMQKVLSIMREHEGDDEVVVHIRIGDDDIPMRSRTLRVDWNELLRLELERLLGPSAVWVEQTGGAAQLAA